MIAIIFCLAIWYLIIVPILISKLLTFQDNARQYITPECTNPMNSYQNNVISSLIRIPITYWWCTLCNDDVEWEGLIQRKGAPKCADVIFVVGRACLSASLIIISLPLTGIFLSHQRLNKRPPFRKSHSWLHVFFFVFKAYFLFKFQRKLLLRLQLTIDQHWFTQWLGTE